MPAASIQPSFTQIERLLGRGIAVTLWVLSAVALVSLALWTGQPLASA